MTSQRGFSFRHAALALDLFVPSTPFQGAGSEDVHAGNYLLGS
jgi:hypothetical protein